jgi:hypothetical protein
MSKVDEILIDFDDISMNEKTFLQGQVCNTFFFSDYSQSPFKNKIFIFSDHESIIRIHKHKQQ